MEVDGEMVMLSVNGQGISSEVPDTGAAGAPLETPHPRQVKPRS
jgi:hypothetical protein